MIEPSRRRWFQFGLRTMFVVVTMFAVWLGYYANWIRQRNLVRAEIVHFVDGTIAKEFVPLRHTMPWQLKLLGESPMVFFYIYAATDLPEEWARVDRIRKICPESHMVVMGVRDPQPSSFRRQLPARTH
jgi:hypothetical protein